MTANDDSAVSSRTTARAKLLERLLALSEDLDAVAGELSQFGWDADEPLVTLMPAHVVGVLRRYRDGVVNAATVERWANAIEGRDDVGFDPRSEDALREAVFELANPVLQGALTRESATLWIERLSAP